ncbi:MAG: family 10 glycosylhydrolase [Prevotella sp.]|jgi:uncharacterized lipoprotein YddW (UPF0748 family)|nr:family 10 glycosylhydrolase [Prevotella sp.]
MKLSRLIFILFLFPISLFAYIPTTEVRAVWLTTNWGLDWPTQGTSVQSQKEQLCKILDQLQEANFNTILFQTRAQGCVFYRSKIEPLSPYFNHDNDFDPLAFAVEECHKRGMECHAWIIAIPMEKATITYTGKGKRRQAVLVQDKPSYYKCVDGRWHLDPGRPETRELIVSIVKEIVENYDVDGINFDYIRYPDSSRVFPDGDTYQKYGQGQNIYDWRRDNINAIVSEAYDTVKSIKKWVQVSSSPLGRYRVLPQISPNDGWTAYETVFQDASQWMNSGKHDMIFPMMYYREDYFYPFLNDWIANSNGRFVVPGLGVYRINEDHWDSQVITEQMQYIRDKNIQGATYMRAGNILSNVGGIMDSIRAYYITPAKLPPLTWLDNEAPNSPVNLQVYKDDEGYLNIKWDAPAEDEDFTYTVYVSTEEDIDVNNGGNILATGLYAKSYAFPVKEGEFGYYYTVTASDRYHNESVIAFPAFFSHSPNEQ